MRNPFRARGQIPVYDLTGRGLGGWSAAPGTGFCWQNLGIKYIPCIGIHLWITMAAKSALSYLLVWIEIINIQKLVTHVQTTFLTYSIYTSAIRRRREVPVRGAPSHADHQNLATGPYIHFIHFYLWFISGYQPLQKKARRQAMSTYSSSSGTVRIVLAWYKMQGRRNKILIDRYCRSRLIGTCREPPKCPNETVVLINRK